MPPHVLIIDDDRDICMVKKAQLELDGAFKVMGEGKETVKAMGDGDVRVEGSPEYAGALGSFMVRVQDLLTPPAK